MMYCFAVSVLLAGFGSLFSEEVGAITTQLMLPFATFFSGAACWLSAARPIALYRPSDTLDERQANLISGRRPMPRIALPPGLILDQGGLIVHFVIH